MLLAIDIGNTNIVAGIFHDTTLLARWRLATDIRRTSDEYAIQLSSLFRVSNLDPGNVSAAFVASVVPDAQETVQRAMRQYWNIDPLSFSHSLNLGIEIAYQPATAVGADRIANAVAAIDQYGCPAIVVDFGTATTFDAVSRDGVYLGGAIAPGLEISEDALLCRTTQLPRARLLPPEGAIGTSTETSLRSGILFGYAGLVDGLVGRIALELGPDVNVISTGGLAETISALCERVQHVNQDLTLHGLRLLHERNA
jgi:type III pantothenate kinase